MVAKKIQAFGGMMPAVDDRLLPDSQAAYSENVWLYNGTLEPLKEQVLVHELASPTTSTVFRIPLSTYDKDAIDDSYWMEFENIDTVLSQRDGGFDAGVDGWEAQRKVTNEGTTGGLLCRVDSTFNERH